jgi:DtxR family transcriptional regulator, Mn-dependent transcriptional regulator
VSQTVARMERDGLIHLADDRQLQFTPHGRLLATRVMRKHRLAERLLVDVIGLEWEFVHDEACRWEHVMSERVERKILGLLTDHQNSPYGNPIPGLDELGEEPGEDFRAGVSTLTELASEQPRVVRVRRIGEPVQVDHEALALLTVAGLLPGERVAVRRRNDRIVAVREGADETAGVSLPEGVAHHVFASVL